MIHAVGPVWRGGNNDEALLLANAYRNSLQIAVSHSIKTIAFPNISTGVYNYPKESAAMVAIKTVKEICNASPTSIKKIYFVCFDAENYDIYIKLLG